MAAERNIKTADFNHGDAAFSARSLPKDNLSAVIFGCTDVTMKECLQKRLFGLPKEHISYVKNIEPGMPLFLFNYSDRKLHGLYEAASCGQMNINPYAWTNNGSEKTQHPSQVQIQVKRQCLPLVEDQLKLIISDNYYRPNEFWFELDNAQATKLMSFLASSAVAPSLTEEDKTEDFPSSSADNHPPGETTELSKVKSIVHDDGPKDLPSRDHSKAVQDNPPVQQGSFLTPTDPEEGREESSELSSDNNNSIKKLTVSETEVQGLKDNYVMLSSVSEPPVSTQIESTPEALDEKLLDPGESIFLLGGSDGSQWLSSIEAYSPSNNLIRSLKPMSSKRSHASAAVLNEEIYVFGGGDAYSFYNSVETYNVADNTWRSQPSLNRKRGSSGGAVLDGKIYALGGGNDEGYLSDVEVLDLHKGRWIITGSLQEKRIGLGAVEFGGVIYACGGYDGNKYLKTAERYDPRESSSSGKIADMKSVRGNHSLAVLNGKIYAVGGFDGHVMVPSVEVCDPRMGSWSSGDPMKHERGHSAIAVVDKAIFIIGGIDDEGAVLQSVECYNEGQGYWRETDKIPITKRYSMVGVVL